MPSIAILHEAQQLHNVSDHLDSLAGQHPLVSDTLITISGSVRNTATLLEVLVATRGRASLKGKNPDPVVNVPPTASPGKRRASPLPKYSWQHAHQAVHRESDPEKLLPLTAYAVVALETRLAVWGQEAATQAELHAILEFISTLRQRLTSWYATQNGSSIN